MAGCEEAGVFGGSSGTGIAVAWRMVARGSRVVITGRDPGRLAAAAARLGKGAVLCMPLASRG